MTIGTADDLVLARDEAERRDLVRAVIEAAPGKLAVFNVVDEHLHLLQRTDWPTRLADGVHRVLRARRKDLDLMRPHVKPIESRGHLERTVKYVLRQTDHHDLGADPATWTGSAFLDLVGARLVPGFDATVLRQELPRLKARELYPAVGLEPLELEPVGDDALRLVGPARLVELAAAVFAADPSYASKRAEVVKARALAAGVGRRLGVPTALLADLLRVVPRNVRYLAGRPIDPRAERALRIRLALELRAARRRRSAS